MLRFAGMQEVGRRAGRTEGRCDVHGDLSCFPHAAGDQVSTEFVYVFHNECHCLFIAVGYRNIAYCFSFLLQDETQTLNDKMIDKIMSKLVKNLEDKLDAKLR